MPNLSEEEMQKFMKTMEQVKKTDHFRIVKEASRSIEETSVKEAEDASVEEVAQEVAAKEVAQAVAVAQENKTTVEKEQEVVNIEIN